MMKMMMMMMMKKPILLVACVLLFSSLAVLASEGSSAPTECCYNIYPYKLPKKNVVSFHYTDERCGKKAVIITMKIGVVFCVDPSVQWVKNIIEAKEWIHTKKGIRRGQLYTQRIPKSDPPHVKFTKESPTCNFSE